MASASTPRGCAHPSLRVYVATNPADGTLTATLSDGSAGQFVNVLPQATDLRLAVYTITYAAASANQKLHIDWVRRRQLQRHVLLRQRGDLAVALQAPQTYVVNTGDDHNDGRATPTTARCARRSMPPTLLARPALPASPSPPGGGAQQIAVIRFAPAGDHRAGRDRRHDRARRSGRNDGRAR